MNNGKRYRAVLPDFQFWKDMVCCQAACPVHTDSGRYVQLIAEGKYREAFLTARSPNPFASVCGRVCAAPCEDKCRRAAVDEAVSIRALKRFVCEQYGVESLAPDTQQPLFEGEADPGNRTPWHLPSLGALRQARSAERRVAVVGAGPAGLACAHDLATLGYRVKIFEASSIPGGMLFHGIPEFRLPRTLIDKEVGTILDLGVELKLNTPLREGFGLRELREEGYEAVFISVGTQRGRDIAVEGADLDGVIRAVDFLLNVNLGYRTSLGSKVLVIGGGFVAFDAARMALRSALEPERNPEMTAALDAARAALRAGVSDVAMISLESFDEMPVMRTAQGREEFEEARKEGVVFRPQRGARRFLGEGGRLRAVELIGVQRTYDENGRFAPVYDSAISETLEADTVILAIGQQADLSFLRPEDGVELKPQGTIRVNSQSMATSAPGVFAGGDVAFGPRNLIEAIANGKRAALSIHECIQGTQSCPQARLWINKLPARTYRMPAGYDRLPRKAPPTLDLGRRTGISEVETGYSEWEARVQAERCLPCHIQTVYDPERCVLCGRCVDVCLHQCLKLVPVEQLQLDSPDAVPFYAGSGNAEPLSAMIKDEEKCIRCGLCAIRCPTDAMSMEVFAYEERQPAGETG
jgi:NADPH-dependent glutamate synthase beta subunit-like oxidoreductase